jgi:hypothetical protein
VSAARSGRGGEGGKKAVFSPRGGTFRVFLTLFAANLQFPFDFRAKSVYNIENALRKGGNQAK